MLNVSYKTVKLRKCTILFKNNYNFDARNTSQNSWDRAMFTTLSSSFMCKHLGTEETIRMAFGRGNIVTLLSDDFSCSTVLGHLCHVFCVMMHQMFLTGEKSGHSATMKPCCVIVPVCRYGEKWSMSVEYVFKCVADEILRSTSVKTSTCSL